MKSAVIKQVMACFFDLLCYVTIACKLGMCDIESPNCLIYYRQDRACRTAEIGKNLSTWFVKKRVVFLEGLRSEIVKN